tara:strand:- start:1088 stop:1474 length:387 start_codon:yes stop_codon:yes gene_type:complete
MKIEVSIGEVFDKVSILEIKREKINDPAKLTYVAGELDIIRKTLNDYSVIIPDLLYNRLKDVNRKLWDTEDIIRKGESTQNFDEEFIKHARLDAKLNDERFLIKNEINNYCNSLIKEQKSYNELYTAD